MCDHETTQLSALKMHRCLVHKVAGDVVIPEPRKGDESNRRAAAKVRWAKEEARSKTAKMWDEFHSNEMHSVYSEAAAISEEKNLNDELMVPWTEGEEGIVLEQSPTVLVQCEVCGLVVNEDTLEAHKVQAHEGELEFNTSKEASENHDEEEQLPDHPEHDPTMCDLCGKIFADCEKLMDHKRRSHPEKKKEQLCEECGKLFLYTCQLTSHMAHVHKIASVTTETHGKTLRKSDFVRKELKVEEMLPPYEEVFIEQRRAKAVVVSTPTLPIFNHLLPRNEKTYLMYYDNEEGGVVSRDQNGDLKLEQTTSHDPGVYKLEPRTRCKVCGEGFDSKKSMHDHISQEHPEHNTNTCDVCGKSFGNHVKLRVHKKRVHMSKRDKQCPECGMMFIHNSRVTQHLKEKHNTSPAPKNDKSSSISKVPQHEMKKHRMKCPVCSSGFGLRKTMLDHISKEHPEYASTCEICGKNFDDYVKLGVHRMRAHLAKKDKPCPECGEMFLFQSRVAQHMKRVHSNPPGKMEQKATTTMPKKENSGTHKQFRSKMRCPVCSSGFNQKKMMLDHIRKEHPEYDPSACDICGKSFDDYVKLRVHKRRNHVAKKDKPCPECGEMFLFQSRVTQHVRSAHKIAPVPTDQKKTALLVVKKDHTEHSQKEANCSADLEQ